MQRKKREKRREYWRTRGKMKKEIVEGRKAKQIVMEIREEGKRVKLRLRRKNKEKVDHLEKKYRVRARKGLNNLIYRYRDLRILSGED